MDGKGLSRGLLDYDAV